LWCMFDDICSVYDVIVGVLLGRISPPRCPTGCFLSQFPSPTLRLFVDDLARFLQDVLAAQEYHATTLVDKACTAKHPYGAVFQAPGGVRTLVQQRPHRDVTPLAATEGIASSAETTPVAPVSTRTCPSPHTQVAAASGGIIGLVVPVADPDACIANWRRLGVSEALLHAVPRSACLQDCIAETMRTRGRCEAVHLFFSCKPAASGEDLAFDADVIEGCNAFAAVPTLGDAIAVFQLGAG
jgi:hypothetical protein